MNDIDIDDRNRVTLYQLTLSNYAPHETVIYAYEELRDVPTSWATLPFATPISISERMYVLVQRVVVLRRNRTQICLLVVEALHWHDFLHEARVADDLSEHLMEIGQSFHDYWIGERKNPGSEGRGDV